MRRPNRQRTIFRGKIESPPEEINLKDVAKKARFFGSVEHKSAPSFAGQPKPRSDCAICPIEYCDKQKEMTAWLKEAIRSGNVSGPWENGFPRYVWTRKANSVFIARLTNQGLGHYKGWPVTDPKQWPKGI